MTNALAVSRLVNVTVNLSPPAAQFPNLNTCLILGSSDVIDTVTRMRSYASLAEVGLDFSTTDPEYLAATEWFAQRPQPTSLLIGRWVADASSGQMLGGPLSAAQLLLSYWTAITDGSFTVTVDGGSPQVISGLNFSGADNLNGVAEVIDAALTGADCTYDSERDRFIITSTSTGATSSVSYLITNGLGTNVSGTLQMLSSSTGVIQANGLATQTAVETVVLFDNRFSSQWYGLIILGATDEAALSVADFIEASSPAHYYAVTTQDTDTLVSDGDCLAESFQEAAYTHSATQYSSTSAYAAVSLLARILTTNWDGNNTAITLMYKQEPGVTAEQLTSTQVDAVEEKNCNVFVAYNNDTAIIQQGKSASGDFIDTVIGVDWLRGQIQTNVYNQLYQTTSKIPQTDAGNNRLATAIEQACQQGVNNGLIAPGVWTAGGFGQLQSGEYLAKGFYVYAPPVAQQSQADREARKSVAFQVAVKLGGAIHTADITVDVNP